MGKQKSDNFDGDFVCLLSKPGMCHCLYKDSTLVCKIPFQGIKTGIHCGIARESGTLFIVTVDGKYATTQAELEHHFSKLGF